MAAYIISYDLNNRKNYPALYDAIKSICAGWCRPVESTWIVLTDLTSAQIRDHVRKSTDSDDSLFVSRLQSPADAAWVGLAPEVSEWLKANL